MTPPRSPGRPLRALLAIMALLLIAAVALRFADDVDWGPDDLAAGAGMLAAVGIAYVLAARVAGKALQHALVGVLLLLAVGFVWARLASGLFD